MDDAVDFVAICSEGMALRTRARGYATITRIAPEEGLIYGEVRMFGPCIWRRDGIYKETACGAAGPLDLMPPEGPGTEERNYKRTTTAEALTAESRFFCCD